MASIQRKPADRRIKKNVRWEVRWRFNGKNKSKTFTVESQAKAFKAEIERAINRDEYVDNTGVTVRDLVEQHRDQATNASSRGSRTMLLNNLGALERMPIAIVRPSDVEAWRTTLINGRPWKGGKPLAESTVQTLSALLHGVFTKAINDDLLARHPMRGVRVRRTRVAVRREDIPTAAEVRKLLEVANATAVGRPRDPVLSLFIRLAAETGMRPGEILGLRVRNIDLLRREVHVVEQLHERTGEHAPLKGGTPPRTVPLHPDTAEAITVFLATHPRTPEQCLILSRNGRPIRSSRMAARFKKAAELAGVSSKPHALRHFYASQLIDAGAPVNVVQKALGHATAAMTLNVYVHLLGDAGESLRGLIRPVYDGGTTEGSGGAGEKASDAG